MDEEIKKKIRTVEVGVACILAGIWVLAVTPHGQKTMYSIKTRADDHSKRSGTEEVWKESVSGARLSKDWGKNLIEVASTQLGYRESTKNFIRDEKGNKKGYTRYGDWYGDAYGHWCAMFISFCMENAQIPEEIVPREANCNRWIQALEDRKLYETSKRSAPDTGDLIFFDRNHDGISEHAGIVKEISCDDTGKYTKIRTIEGNTGADVVKEKEYAFDDPGIAGYGKVGKAQKRWRQISQCGKID